MPCVYLRAYGWINWSSMLILSFHKRRIIMLFLIIIIFGISPFEYLFVVFMSWRSVVTTLTTRRCLENICLVEILLALLLCMLKHLDVRLLLVELVLILQFFFIITLLCYLLLGKLYEWKQSHRKTYLYSVTINGLL